MYSGYQTGKAYLNNSQIKVADQRPLKETIVYGDFSKFELLSGEKQRKINQNYFEVMSRVYRVRAFGCGSLGLCWIASGGFDAFIDFTGKTKIYDVCAGLAILEAAGGVYEHIAANGEKKLIAATNRTTLAAIKKLII